MPNLEKVLRDMKNDQTLTSINLYNNQITATGAQHLSEALKVNQTLTSIDLGENQITDTGTQHLSELLKVN